MKKLIGNPFFLLLGMIISLIDGVVNLVLPHTVLLVKNIWVRIIFESIIIALVMFKPSGLLMLVGLFVSIIVAIVLVLSRDPYAKIEFQIDKLDAGEVVCIPFPEADVDS